MEFVRAGAGQWEKWAVDQFHNGNLSTEAIRTQLQESAFGLAGKNGFYPGDVTGNPTTQRFINGTQLDILAEQTGKSDELVKQLRDFENARYAVNALSRMRDKEDAQYWRDTTFQRQLDDTKPVVNRLSTKVKQAIAGRRKELTMADPNSGPARGFLTGQIRLITAEI